MRSGLSGLFNLSRLYGQTHGQKTTEVFSIALFEDLPDNPASRDETELLILSPRPTLHAYRAHPNDTV